jgi:hypothetical protein
VSLVTRHTRWSLRSGFGAVAVGLAIGLATVGASLAGTAADRGTFTDPPGDAQGGPDLTDVIVYGDPMSGGISISVRANGYDRPADGLERGVYVWIDADGSYSTGDPDDGTEYGLTAWSDADGYWWNFRKWSGSSWEWVRPPHPTVTFRRSGDLLSWSVNKSDLGGSSRFSFYVLAGTWISAGQRQTIDLAPDGSGMWTYDLVPPPPPTVLLRLDAPKATPARLVAGRRATVTFVATFERHVTAWVVDPLDPSGGREEEMVMFVPVTSGRVTCDPTVAGKRIAHTESLTAGKATLSFTVPRAAKGKLVRVSVRITATDPDTGTTLTASRTAGFRVR